MLDLNHENINVSAFSAYSNEIEELLNACAQGKQPVNFKKIIPAILNGKTALALHRLVPVEIRKKGGIFFTGNYIADKSAIKIREIIQQGVKIFDPACGAGNLLIACAKFLPKGKDIIETLNLWSDLIIGYDLHQEFIYTAKLRLVLYALSLHDTINYSSIIPNLKHYFPYIQQGNSLELKNFPPKTSCIIVNPLFGYIVAPKDCKWATGKVQIAGLFIEKIIKNSLPNQHIVAILPDVLRSGTRYNKWRSMIVNYTKYLSIELAGKFDSTADIDVFILHMVIGTSAIKNFNWSIPETHALDKSQKLVSDYFHVHVGPVVPHRDDNDGQLYPFIHAKNSPNGQTLNTIVEKRKYFGKVFKPPLVVIHRTSSPSDKIRCKGTIIYVNDKVAIENHLLVLIPKDKKLSTCKKLLNLLNLNIVNEWINKRIRCRHLTVSVLKELPWFD